MTRPTTIKELCDRAERWALSYYCRKETYNVRDALRALRAVAGGEPPEHLAAETLCEAQSWMIERGLSRRTINDRINRIRRICRWAARPPQRWLTAAQIADLSLVEPLKRGRTPAPESAGVEPVAWETVSTTIAAADLELATAIELHWWSGMRPGELVRMRRSELTALDDEVWSYRPKEHKTAHHGHERVVLLGPASLAVLRPWLNRLPAPPEGDRLWRWSNAVSYRQAIARLNARIARQRPDLEFRGWTPAQLRHTAATRVRSAADLEAARVILGHRHASTTEIYAEQDLARAVAAARRCC